MTDSLPSSPLPTVAVLGCGWLGLPLARALVAAGYAVHGTTTTPAQLLTLRRAGILPFLLRVGPDMTATDVDTLRAVVQEVDVLVVNLPPSRAAGTAAAYPALLATVLEAATRAGVRHVLHVSSTGVYPDDVRPMHEPDALASAGAAAPLLRAEALFQGAAHTVVRLAGLIGPGRPPGRFLSGRTGLSQGSAPVNLIHLDDCVGLLLHLIEHNFWGYTFNASATHHPLRRDFYPQAAAHLDLPAPEFLPETTGGKTIDSSLVREVTGYQFQHDDLLAALAYC